jgi:hypothetical protein
MEAANTLADYNTTTNIAIKSFIVQALGGEILIRQVWEFFGRKIHEKWSDHQSGPV